MVVRETRTWERVSPATLDRDGWVVVKPGDVYPLDCRGADPTTSPLPSGRALPPSRPERTAPPGRTKTSGKPRLSPRPEMTGATG